MTEPLTSATLDLRDFPYMPLDVVRLRDSESSVICTGEEFRAAVLLWCAAWHQVPAASLPTDDRLLANLAGYGRDIESWKAVRDGALRGFILCDDGRLYHPVIAEKANEADTKRKGYSDKMAKARAALADRRASTTETATETMTETIIDSNKGHKGREGKGIEGKEEKKDSRAVAMATRPHDRFEEFWKAYPRRDGANPKSPARKKFFAFVKSGVDPGDIIDGLRGYGAECAAKNQIGTPYVAQAMTWLSQERWNDYRAPPGDDAMTDAKRAELFAKLRGTDAQQGQSSEGRGVHAARAGARENQGAGRQGAAEPPDDPAGDGGVLRVAAVFPRNAGLRAFGDEAGGDGSIEGDDRARGAA